MGIGKWLRNRVFESAPTRVLSLLEARQRKKRKELRGPVLVNEARPVVTQRILIDTTRLARLNRVTGITRLIKNLGEAVALVGQSRNYDVKFVVFGDDGFLYSQSTPRLGGSKGLDLSETGERIVLCSGDTILFADVASAPYGPSAAEVEKLRKLGVRVFFIGYDVLPKTHPHFFRRYSRLVYDKWLEAALRSDGILFISGAAERDFHRFVAESSVNYPHAPSSGVSHPACEAPISLAEAATGRASLLDRDCFSFLMVGTIEPRKGHQSVLEAFEELWTQGYGHTLTILGGTGWLSEPLERRIRRHSQLGHRLFFLDQAGEDDLWEQYLVADALIANSEAEGFGLPLIEAASVGLPIIARRIEPFIEIAGDAAFYLDSGDARHLTTALQEWCALANAGTNPDSSKIPVRRWSEVAEDTVSFLMKNKFSFPGADVSD